MLIHMFFFLSVLALAAGAVCAVIAAKMKYRRTRFTTPFNMLFCGVLLAAIFLFIPIYSRMFAGESFQRIKSVLLSVYTTIRLFLVDGEFAAVTEFTDGLSDWIRAAYSIYAAVIFVLAPFLTFGFVLTFFKNILAYQYYLAGYFKEVYIFSELNEKSLVLSESLKRNNSSRMIVFANAGAQEDVYELQERVRRLGAVCFKKDILGIHFKRHSKKKGMTFFVIGNSEVENIQAAIALEKKYGDREKTHLYLFAAGIVSELAMSVNTKSKMKIRRVKEEQSLINRILYDGSHRIFEHALPINENEKQITAVIVGMGNYGMDMVKSLVWYCQMDGYKIQIEAFDQDEDAEQRFTALCPELMDDKYNGISEDGEAQYCVKIHSGVSTDTKLFADEIQKLPATYVFVALGSDEENIRTAVNLRMLFERAGMKPVIQAVVFNSAVKNALCGGRNYRGQEYQIDFIGDMLSSYSEEVILDSELEADALARHLKWGAEEDFWRYEYNYCSSVASAIHMKARSACHIPGADKEKNKLTEKEREIIEKLEHRRWNAYMRSQGYVYSGSPENDSRNDLGKMHNNLVGFSALTEEDKRKDS